MINFNEQLSANNNAEIAALWLSTISAAQLYELVKDLKPDTKSILESEEVIEGILASGDSAKKLVLAKFGMARHFDGLKSAHVMQLSKESIAHKCALLENSRIEWYGFDFDDDCVKNELLIPTLLDIESPATLSMLRNPRMDRRLIAEAIRGNKPFDSLSLQTRCRYAIEALRAVEIESPFNVYADGQTTNEMHFGEPIAAAYYIARIYDHKWHCADLVTALIPYDIHIEEKDWISEEEAGGSYPKGFHRACDKIIDWIETESANIPLVPNKSEKDYERFGDFTRGHLLVLIAKNAILRYPQGFNKESFDRCHKSSSWILRAAAYAANKNAKHDEEYTNLDSLAIQDAAAYFRGIILTKYFWQFKNAPKIQELAKKCEIPEYLLEHINNDLQAWPRKFRIARR